MRIEWAIPCSSVSFEGGMIKTLENAAFDTLTTQTFPAELTFVVLARFVGQRPLSSSSPLARKAPTC